MTKIVLPTQERIHDILNQNGYFSDGGTYGYVIGVTSPELDEPAFLFDGQFLNYNQAPMLVDVNTRFELDSNSKIFTAALLTRLAQKNPMLWNSSVASFVPKGMAPLPSSFDGITLLNLANYTSGLPEDDESSNVDSPSILPQPYTAASMYSYLSRNNVAVKGTGTTFTYSNMAVSLLALALPEAIKSDLSFIELLKREITDPLGMQDTTAFCDVPCTELPLPMENGSATNTGWPLFPAFLGGGGLVSTPTDMMRWLQFNMGMRPDSPLNDILAPMQSPSTTVAPDFSCGGQLGIGWFLNTITAKVDGKPLSFPIVWKAGEITGCSFTCFLSSPDPGKAPSPAGVFVLSNNTPPDAGTAAAYYILLAMLGYDNPTDVNSGP